MIQIERNVSGENPNDKGASVFGEANTYYGSTRDVGAYAVLAEANALAVCGVCRAVFELKVEIPAQMDKARINAIRNHTKWAVELLEAQGFGAEVRFLRCGRNAAIGVPAVTVTAVGVQAEETAGGTVHPGADVVLVGEIATEGMLRIIGETEEKLRERFTPAFLRQMKASRDELCGIPKIRTAAQCGAQMIRQIGEGGVLAALWDLTAETGCGLSLDLKQFLIRQEAVEVCECFRLNPYQLTSNGSFLAVAKDGAHLAQALREAGYAASVLGQLTGDKGKQIHNGEEVRCIDRPAPDELQKVF